MQRAPCLTCFSFFAVQYDAFELQLAFVLVQQPHLVCSLLARNRNSSNRKDWAAKMFCVGTTAGYQVIHAAVHHVLLQLDNSQCYMSVSI